MKESSDQFGCLRTASDRLDGGERHVWKRRYCMFAAFILTVIYTAAVTKVFPWVYQMNDDRFMKEVLSGVYNGIPDAHVIFIKYPLAWLIRNLYIGLLGWDWYGIVMASVNLACLCLILYRFLRVRETWKGKCFLLLMALTGYTAAWLLRLLAFTYTTAAAMAGATALFWYASGSKQTEHARLRGDGVTVLLALTAYLLRDSVFFMLMPFAAVLFLNRLSVSLGNGRTALNHADGQSFNECDANGYPRDNNNVNKWKVWAIHLAAPLLLGILMLLCRNIDQAAYEGAEWRRILGDGDARSVIYNYCGPADYEAHQDFYEEIGVSRDTWQALVRYNLVVDEDLDTEHLYRIASYSQQAYRDAHSFGTRVKEGLRLAWEGAVQNGCKPLDQVSALLFVWVLVWAAVKRDRRIFLSAVGVAAVAVMLWIALGMGGRLPKRVAESLHLCALLSAAGLYLQGGLANPAVVRKKKGPVGFEARASAPSGNKRPVWFEDEQVHLSRWGGFPRGIRAKLFFLLAGIPTMLVLLISAYKWIGHTVRPAMAGAENYQIMVDYCGEHPELFYLADVYSIVGYTDRFTLRDETEEMNYLPLGDWLAFSPMYEAKLDSRGIDNLAEDILTKGNIRILCRDYYDMDYLLDYYTRHGYDGMMTVEDTIVQNGEAMDVYRFELRRR